MAWRHAVTKPLSKPIMVSLLTHICVTWPPCVNGRLYIHVSEMRHCHWCNNMIGLENEIVQEQVQLPWGICLNMLHYLIEAEWRIYASIRYTIIGSDNGLWPGRSKAIIWTNAGILSIGPLRKDFSEILIEIHTFSFTKMHLKMSSGKWRPFWPGLNALIPKELQHRRTKTKHTKPQAHLVRHIFVTYILLLSPKDFCIHHIIADRSHLRQLRYCI